MKTYFTYFFIQPASSADFSFLKLYDTIETSCNCLIMIEINNLTTVSIDTEFLKKIVRKVLKKEKISGEVGLSIALIRSERMREINKRYRGKNRVTDVLSFSEKKVLGEKLKKIHNLGEIVICLQEEEAHQNSSYYCNMHSRNSCNMPYSGNI